LRRHFDKLNANGRQSRVRRDTVRPEPVEGAITVAQAFRQAQCERKGRAASAATPFGLNLSKARSRLRRHFDKLNANGRG
jgi:hypothetical protein